MKSALGTLMSVCLLPPAVELGIDAFLPAVAASPLLVVVPASAAVFALTPAGALVVVAVA